MARRNRPRLRILSIALASVVLAGACSQSNTPKTWEEAEADGSLRQNFSNACVEANTDGGDVEFTDDQATDYCMCAFEEIVEYFGGEIQGDNTIIGVVGAVEGRNFDAFKDLESDLRSNPEEIPADIEGMLNGCSSRALD